MATLEGPAVQRWPFSFLSAGPRVQPRLLQDLQGSCLPTPPSACPQCLLSCWSAYSAPLMCISLQLELRVSGWLQVVLLQALCCRGVAFSVPCPQMGSMVSGFRHLLWGESGDLGLTLGACVLVLAASIAMSPGGGEHLSLTRMHSRALHSHPRCFCHQGGPGATHLRPRQLATPGPCGGAFRKTSVKQN